jgi:agmatinase
LPAHLDPRTSAFRGLWDHDSERLLLEGARFRDHGNVFIDPSASTNDAYQSIHAAARQMLERSPGIPVVLGGDHSLSEPILRAVTELGQPVFVVHFDAHTDMSPAYRGRAHHHGSVMDLIRRLPAVSGILQIGVRDFGPPWWKGVEKTQVISCARAQRITTDELMGFIPEDSRCYVSIDIDVLDPSEAPGTGVPVPGGLRLFELERLIGAVGSARHVIGLDLVEVAPNLDRGQSTALAAVRVLVRLLDAIQQRNLAGSAPGKG